MLGQTVVRRLPTSEIRVQSQGSPSVSVRGEVALIQVFIRVLWSLPVSVNSTSSVVCCPGADRWRSNIHRNAAKSHCCALSQTARADPLDFLHAQKALAVHSVKARCNGDSLRSASARGKRSCPVATAALSTRIARPRVQNRATLPSCCRSLTR
jgi:hypothetical protein